MVKRLTAEGYSAVKNLVQEANAKGGVVYILFSGSVDETTGQNWCPDCVTADPVVERNIERLPEKATFIHCHVGQRAYWKDPNNDFRKDSQFKLTCVPTLLQLGTPKRLQEGECAKDDLIQMMFEED